MALNGSLDDYSPAGALRVLSSTGKTGAVRFTGSGGCTAYLCEGQLYFARGEETDDALASALVRPGRLSAEAWTAAVEEAGDTPRVGEILVANGAIDADLLASVVLSVIYDPLITLFREGDGQFDFEADTMHWIGPFRGFNVEAIVNEVRRRVRNVDEMSDIVPSLGAWVSPARTLPGDAAQVTLLREDWELVTSLSGPRTVRELAGALGRGQYSTAQVVHRLARAGLLEVTPEPFGPLDDDPVHEPSAAERLAAAAEPAPLAEPDDLGFAPLDDDVDDGLGEGIRSLDHDPRIGGFDADPAPPPSPDEAEAWSASWGSTNNPFEHPVDDVRDELGVTFGPSLGAAGPEMAPEESTLLPRRTSVREADPAHRPAVDAELAGTPPVEDLGAALAGIAGFHDPMSQLHRDDQALADATSGPALDDNAAWLENLYAQFIDASDEPPSSKSRKKEALDVAFQSDEQGEGEKTGTLRRLVDALRRL